MRSSSTRSGFSRPNRVQPFDAPVGTDDVKALAAQDKPDQIDHFRLVFDADNPLGLCRHGSSRPAADREGECTIAAPQRNEDAAHWLSQRDVPKTRRPLEDAVPVSDVGAKHASPLPELTPGRTRGEGASNSPRITSPRFWRGLTRRRRQTASRAESRGRWKLLFGAPAGGLEGPGIESPEFPSFLLSPDHAPRSVCAIIVSLSNGGGPYVRLTSAGPAVRRL